MSEQQRQYRDMTTTASWTLVSRVLGLFRDQLMTATFGAGIVSSAFLLAFQIPNLFRRLLGEGALTAALVPALANKLTKEGRPAAFAFLNHVLRRVLPWMTGIALLGLGTAVGLSLTLDGQGALAAELTAWCIPYMPLICAAALFTGALQLCGRFGLAEIAAGVLNLCLITSLLWLGPWLSPSDLAGQARILCIATVIGGICQLLIPLIGLRKEGWQPKPATADNQAWETLRNAFVPALLGAGVLQLNLLFSRLLAFGVDDKALTHYYVANRVTELPVGLFSVSVAAVIFPALATAFAQGDREALCRNYARGSRLVMAINIGAAVAFAALAKPILELLFQYGRFNGDDVKSSSVLLVLFSASMPFYALSALTSRALNVIGRTDATLFAAMHALGVNAVLSILLTYTPGLNLNGANGLAIANLVAAIWQLIVLKYYLRKAEPAFFAESLLKPLFQVLFGSFILGAVAYNTNAWLHNHFWGQLPSKVLIFATMSVSLAVACGLYAWILDQFGYPERDLIRGYIDKIAHVLWIKRRR